MTRGLKTWFGVHAVVALFFGLALYLVPAFFGRIVAWPGTDIEMSRLFGAALIGLGVASGLSAMTHHWDEVRIVVETEVVYCVLGALVTLFNMVMVGATWFVWLTLLVYVVFGAAFGWYLAPSHHKIGAPLAA